MASFMNRTLKKGVKMLIFRVDILIITLPQTLTDLSSWADKWLKLLTLTIKIIYTLTTVSTISNKNEDV